MRRRDFLGLLGAAAVVWPLGVRAQQTGKPPIIGFLGADASVWTPWAAAFEDRLRDLGWIKGQTVVVEYRWSERRSERYAEIATEFVRLKVDVIVTIGPAVAALKQATSVIPIVFALANDPLGSGLVTSLSRPGGNVTGLSLQATDLAGKRLDLLRQVIPRLRRLAVIFNIGNPQAVLEMGEVQATARMLGLDVTTLDVRRDEDIAPALETLKGSADALYVVGDAFVTANRGRIITFALGALLPTIFNNRDQVQARGLMSYGPNFLAQYRRAAELVDKILHGAQPGDIPVEQPTRFDLAINLTTAKLLGLTMSEKVLALADEVIE
jgi:putative ABC transport system substrate-binding protein